MKRWLRELARRELFGALPDAKTGMCADVVIRAKPEAYRATLPVLQTEFTGLGTRIARLVLVLAPRTPDRESTPASEG